MKLYHSSNVSVEKPDTAHSRDFLDFGKRIYRKPTTMTEESKMVLRASKVANIIMSLCELYKVSLKDATDIYYRSTTSDLIEEGVADLQCRSDKYLATLVWEEYQENMQNQS